MRKRILVVLFALLLCLPALAIPMRAEPISETKQLLNMLVDMPGALNITKNFVVEPLWNTSGSQLTQRTPLEKNQVCFGLGDFAGTNVFELVEREQEQLLLYRGKAAFEAKVSVVCNQDKEALMEDLVIYDLLHEGSPNCEICGSEKCCAVVLRGETPLFPVTYEGSFDELLQMKESVDAQMAVQRALERFVWSWLPLVIAVVAVALGAVFWKRKRRLSWLLILIAVCAALFWFFVSTVIMQVV